MSDDRYPIDLCAPRNKRRPRPVHQFASLADALRFACALARANKGKASILVDGNERWPSVTMDKGFSMMELVVWLAITATLAAVAMPLMGQRKPTAAGVIRTITQAEEWGHTGAAITVYHELPPTSCPDGWTCSVHGRMPVPTGFLTFEVSVTDPAGVTTLSVHP